MGNWTRKQIIKHFATCIDVDFRTIQPTPSSNHVEMSAILEVEDLSGHRMTDSEIESGWQYWEDNYA